MPSGSRAEFQVGSDQVVLADVIDGAGTINGTQARSDDAVRIEGTNSMTVEATASIDLLVAFVPANPSYQPQCGGMQRMDQP